ncbi:hypothetical protein ACPA9J_19000 [Pseudomonas aeruginosa]
MSWRIPLRTCRRSIVSLTRAPNRRLPAKTSAFRDWAGRLQAYAAANRCARSWAGGKPGWAGSRPSGHADRPRGDNREALAESVSLRLDPQRTRQLLQQAPAAYRTQVKTCC